MGVTTATPSVTPAPKPAALKRGQSLFLVPKGYTLTDKDLPNTRLPRILICQPPLVRLKTRKPDRHLGNDTRQHRSQPFIQRERRFSLDDVHARRDEPSRSHPGCSSGPGKLHADFDGIQRLTYQLQKLKRNSM